MTYDPTPDDSSTLDQHDAATIPAGTPADGTDAIGDSMRDESDTATTSEQSEPGENDRDGNEAGGVHMSYGRFGAMIATSTVVMFGLMYLNTYAWDHVRWSETRAYMALLMGGAMAIIMLGFMFSMYRKPSWNIAIFAVAAVTIVGSLALVRSQITVQDTSYMRAMIPHHSIAILTSERAQIDDVRVCELATKIIEAQRREIDEMDWLISDISDNGAATTAAEADARPAPDFTGTAIRTCP